MLLSHARRSPKAEKGNISVVRMLKQWRKARECTVRGRVHDKRKDGKMETLESFLRM